MYLHFGSFCHDSLYIYILTIIKMRSQHEMLIKTIYLCKATWPRFHAIFPSRNSDMVNVNPGFLLALV